MEETRERETERRLNRLRRVALTGTAWRCCRVTAGKLAAADTRRPPGLRTENKLSAFEESKSKITTVL